MPGAKIFEVEKNSFTASLISVLLVNAILGGCGPAPQGGGTPKMRLPLSIMTKTKSMDQVWGLNSTTPFHSLFGFLVPLLLKANKLVLGAISLLLVVLIIILVAVFAVPLFSSKSNQLKCATDEFACKNGEKCIPNSLTCNGKLQDCSDGSDEECYDLVRTCYS